MENIKGKLSLRTADFNKLITEDMIYVDKTPFIKQLIDHKKTYYFLSRPRRFGKTLFISTLENFFKGKKELFKNTSIYNDSDWKWDKYPIINISMKSLSNENPQLLEKDILDLIEDIAKKNKVKITGEGSYIRKFTKLIEEISNKNMVNGNNGNVVVLIDEYDSPILNHINNTDLANNNREILQEFYNVLKESEKYLKFVFITGISKFTKTSIFSNFNNFVELSLHEDYITICGITPKELEHYYHNHLKSMGLKNKLTYDEVLDKFHYWYDGYSWDGINKVFNPFSTLNALYERKFMGFWFGSGTPTFLAEIFKHREIIGDYSEAKELKYSELDAIDPENINETALLFQGGYLTIDKEFIKDDIIHFSLKIPNFEVEQAYKDNFLKLYMEKFENKFKNSQQTIWDEIINGNCKMLSENLRAFITGIPYYNRISMDNEEKWKVYSMIFTIWAEAGGFYLTVEKTIEDGRIDFVLENINTAQVLIVEMKYTADQSKSLDTLINEAFKQIKDKKYWWAYTGQIKLMALALKDIKIDEGFITNVKCKIKDVPKE